MKKNENDPLLSQKITRKNVFSIINEQNQNILNVPLKIVRMISKANKKPRAKDENKDLKNTDDNIFDIQNVTKYYLSGNVLTNVLKNISFTIKRGEYVAILGKSGSGKSTLLNLMSGLDRASNGNVIVNNLNLPYLSDNKLTKFRRNNVSFIFQSYNLLQNLTSYDNVMSGAYLQKDKTKLLNIDELFKEYDVEDVKYKFPSTMSGGQQQRISILRALIKNAPIIFADEPTGALDPGTAKIVLESLDGINKKYGTTIVMVSHDKKVEELADKVIYLKNGYIEKIRVNKTRKDPKEILI
ncbi:ABC transporter, ATP-binding protein [Mycoplasmopsis californica]|uniref:ABC transporter ATP-binding protein n=1 Tax=Mycoplasmopsis equigenitalium TaxID=114883 RepID=A0ABY5J290_9BACT|nr:ABC transporter ATP-binding protein [Mycoplasmopsis equigenitalium]UUD36888.1 ABC transporter ATP-binding protein [Mycoplasmopsis equigenitalium]VEU69817.1 ABC transporter, ATP-binding protein [Mycoplasmopsis californica]